MADITVICKKCRDGSAMLGSGAIIKTVERGHEATHHLLALVNKATSRVVSVQLGKHRKAQHVMN